MNKQRMEWLDCLRAVAMVFVIYGHINNSAWQFFLFTSPIKIPLFFAVSGYLFKNGGQVLTKVKKLFISIIIPYFFLSLFPFKLIAALLSSGGKSAAEVMNLFMTGEYLWYLPCLFIAELIFYFITKYSRKNTVLVLLSVSVAVAGFALSKTAFGHQFYISNALISQLYLLIGYEMRKYENKIDAIGNKTIIALIAVYISLGVLSMYIFPAYSFNARENVYYNLPLCLAMITVGCFTMITAFRKWNVHSRVLSFIGQNTLTYYAFNKYFRTPVIYVLSLMDISLQLNWWTGILLTTGCCLVCAPISLILNRYLPFCVGKRKN